MKLDKNFTLHELTYSMTALKYEIDNIPNDEELRNLQLVTHNILQPVRDNFAQPVHVSSGFRSVLLNNIVSKSKVSQHMTGKAVDFEIFGVDNKEVAIWIQNNLKFDQLILEYYNPGEINSGWIHCSYDANYNRMEQLLINKGSRQLVQSF